MRKFPAALALTALTAVGLTGCSLPAGTSACPRPAVSDADVMDLISVSGAPDAMPEVEVYAPFSTTSVEFEDVSTGTGPALTTDSQIAVIDVTLLAGDSGEVVGTTAYSGDLSSTLSMSQVYAAYPGLEEGLQCATEGSRVAVALSPEGLEPTNAARLGLGANESAIAVVDLRKVYLPHAEGTLQFNSGFGLPSVVRAEDGRPGIIVPDGAAPDELVVQTLIVGDGEEVTGDRPVRVHYTGVTWDDKDVFDSSWDSEPRSMSLDSVVPGFAQALEGQTVGSQVMVVIPPELGYGDVAQGSIPAGSTLVFVIDILGLDQPTS